MSSPASLRAALGRALGAVLAGPVALAGCGVDTTGYAAPACSGGSLAVEGLSPSVIPDVVQLRAVSSVGPGGAREAPRVISSSGSACASASNPAQCEATLASLAPAEGFRSDCFQLCVDYHLALTRGDAVEAVSSLGALRTFLGTVDTPQEAALLAFAEGYSVACDRLERGGVRPGQGGYDVIATTGFACGAGSAVTRHVLRVAADGTLTEVSSEVIERGDPNCAIGRRPPGLASSGDSGCGRPLGAFFARVAHLEAASVPAFLRLADELEAHGAPEALVALARRAACDEVRHAQATAALARAHGAEPEVARVEPRPLRSLFELALDNATEGCVRETFGALVALHQARAATDPAVREALGPIAEDEARHAELSWGIDGWARRRLGPLARTALDEASGDALARLREALEAPPPPQVVAQAGLPDAATARALVDGFARELGLAT